MTTITTTETKPTPYQKLRQQEAAAMLARIGQALRLDPAATLAYVAAYPKPMWYIMYRLETGQDPKAPFPRVEQ